MSARIPAPVAVAQQPREIFTSLSIRHSSPLYFDRCCYLDQRQKHTGQTSADCGFIRNSFSASYHRYFSRTWYLLFTENQVVAMEREAFYGDEFGRIYQSMSVAGSGFRLGYLHR